MNKVKKFQFNYMLRMFMGLLVSSIIIISISRALQESSSEYAKRKGVFICWNKYNEKRLVNEYKYNGDKYIITPEKIVYNIQTDCEKYQKEYDHE